MFNKTKQYMIRFLNISNRKQAQEESRQESYVSEWESLECQEAESLETGLGNGKNGMERNQADLSQGSGKHKPKHK